MERPIPREPPENKDNVFHGSGSEGVGWIVAAIFIVAAVAILVGAL